MSSSFTGLVCNELLSGIEKLFSVGADIFPQVVFSVVRVGLFFSLCALFDSIFILDINTFIFFNFF